MRELQELERGNFRNLKMLKMYLMQGLAALLEEKTLLKYTMSSP